MSNPTNIEMYLGYRSDVSENAVSPRIPYCVYVFLHTHVRILGMLPHTLWSLLVSLASAPRSRYAASPPGLLCELRTPPRLLSFSPRVVRASLAALPDYVTRNEPRNEPRKGLRGSLRARYHLVQVYVTKTPVAASTPFLARILRFSRTFAEQK